MRLRRLILLFAALFAPMARAETLQASKRAYEESSKSEAERIRYVTRLAEKAQTLIAEHMRTARHDRDQELEAIYSELKLHPAPKSINSSMLRVGKWESPRHDYLYRKDGTWSMLPLEPGVTHGKWRIQGNESIESWAGDVAKPARYQIILLDKNYFVFMDAEKTVYVEWRLPPH
jgi:hypothetical protein